MRWGELQVISPFDTWEMITPWTKGFAIGGGEETTLTVTVSPPHGARPAEYWALVKVMYFGRLHYTEALRVRIGEADDNRRHPGPIVATVAGRAIAAEMVEARLAAVGRGAMADWLPAAGVEDRRWRRWMAHLLVTEALVWSEAGADPDNPDLFDDVVPTSNGSHPDEAARLEAAARTLFDRVTSNGGE